MTLQPQNVVMQTVAGAGQFTGLAGAGLFSFAALTGLPMSSRIVVSRAAYHANANPGTQAQWRFVEPTATPPTAIILLGRAVTATLAGPDGDGDLVVCPGEVPRRADGQPWDLVLTTTGKTGDGTALIAYSIVEGEP